MKLTTIFIATALMVITPCITHAENAKGKLQGKMIEVGISNYTAYPAKAHLKDHLCMYDVNKNRNFTIAPGAKARIRAETKASGGCFLSDSWMKYEILVAVPNISPIKIGECKITKQQGDYGSYYLWNCTNQSVSDFSIKSGGSTLLINQK